MLREAPGVERLVPADLDLMIDGLFGAEVPVRVLAVSDNGGFTTLPASVPVRGDGAVGGATTILDLVVPEDRPTVLGTWERARTVGAARGPVHLVGAPDAPVDLQFVDARHRYGVYLAFLVGAALEPTAAGATAGPELRPRRGVTHKDELAVLTACDGSFCQMLGYHESDLIGRCSLELVHPEDHARAVASWVDLAARPGAEGRVRLRHLRSDGSYVWLELTNTNHLDDPERGYVLGEAVDVSEELAAVEALRASESLLRSLTEALPVGVVQFDRQGIVVHRTRRAEVVLGRRVPVGGPLADVVPPGDPARAVLVPLVDAALYRGLDGEREVPFETADGSVRTIRVSLRQLTGTDGTATGAIACLDDVTEAALLREALARRATYDALTRCLSRGALLDRIDALLAADVTVTALFIDLDGFKSVNDRYGHAVGDELLVHVGARLLEHVGGRGLVGRLGGDEFLVAITDGPGVPGARGRSGVVDDDAGLRRTVAEAVGVPVVVDGVHLVARASVGVARSVPGMTSDTLIAEADRCMYRNKTERRRSRPPVQATARRVP